MSTLTLYPVDASAGGYFKLQINGSAPSNATTATGWTVGTVASGNYARMFYNVERTSGNFTGTAQPGAAVPDATNFDCFRTDTPITGTFASGNWDVAIGVIAVTAGGEQDGAFRFRLYKGAASDGSDATEVTSAAQECSAVTNLTTGSAQLSSLTTWNPGTFTCTNEYLFVKSAWRITGAGAGSTRDVLLRVGSVARIVTTDLTTTASVTGLEATSALGTVSALGDGTAAVSGVSATSALGTVSALGNGLASVSGVAGTSAIGAVDGLGDGLAALTGLEATSAVGDVTADGTTGGEAPPVETPAPVGGGGGSGGVSFGGPVRYNRRRNGRATVQGVEARGAVGQVSAHGSASASVAGVGASIGLGAASARGQHNPTDEQWATMNLLLVAA